MTFKNLALGTVLTPPSPADSGLSLVLNSGEGNFFPDAPTDGDFYCTAIPPQTNPSIANSEIIKVTARSTDTFTIERAQRGSTAKSIAAGWIIIQGIYAEDFFGSNSLIPEVPTGTVDGSNDEFTLANEPIAGSLQLYKDGQFMKPTVDYTISGSTITFVEPPEVDSELYAFYWLVASTSANAATLGGYPASSFLDPLETGWNPMGNLTRVSDTTATIEGDYTSKIKKGDKLFWLSDGSPRYNYVVADPSFGAGVTTLTITSGYVTTANDSRFESGHSLTAGYWSHVENPVGFPDWFNYTPTLTTITQGNGTILAKFRLKGSIVDFVFRFIFGSSGSAMGTGLFSIPIVSDSAMFNSVENIIGQINIKDIDGSSYNGFCRIETTTDNSTVRPLLLNAASTYLSPATIGATAPMTWASGDILFVKGSYKI